MTRKYIATKTTKDGIEIEIYQCTNSKGETWTEYEVISYK